MKKKLNRKGFTLIELLVVVTIIGILVMLATPRFMGYTERANTRRIQNDVRVAEGIVEEILINITNLPKEWEDVSVATLRTAKDENKLYGKGGLVHQDNEKESVIEEGNYKLIPSSLVKKEIGSKLRGSFYTNDIAKVYYEDVSESDIPGYVMAKDSDFEWVRHGSGYEATNEEGSGYYRYIGDDEYVIIPHEINGHPMTSYYRMFYDTGSHIKGVASDNKNVTNMSYMFRSSRATQLDLSSFDTSNVIDMGGMFYDSRATQLDLSSFDTSKVTDMSHMFAYSRATTGYARTQDDADRFNGSSLKPSGLTFVVKGN